MKKWFTSIVFMFLTLSLVYAQRDTVFWFAAPEIAQAIGFPSGNLDRPVYLRITAFGSPAVVTITQPANSFFIPIVRNITANRSVNVDLTPFIDSIECKPANVVLNYGLKIAATQPVEVYYDEASRDNPELFALKGSNAVGTNFFIPSQTELINQQYSPGSYFAFDIVATEDNTSVNITPTQGIVGHPAGIPFTIQLNKGQTYSATSTTSTAAGHPAGSVVSANKPIAVTIKDDLLNGSPPFGNGHDCAGDQLIPVNVIGTEYIAVRGRLNSPFDRIFVLATQNNTTITQDGNNMGVINQGAQTMLSMIGDASYILADKPVYLLQLSGGGGEAGLAILPPIRCTGSYEIAYTRSTADSLYVQLLVPAGGQGSFLFNGASGIINPASFLSVPATNNLWYYARLTISTAQLPKDSSVIITNTAKLFHMSVINGTTGGGQGFGYFSNYNSLSVEAHNNSPICPGAILQLSADTIPGTTYQWAGPNGFTSTLRNPTKANFSAADTGIYTLTARLDSCSSITTTYVTIGSGTAPVFSLGNDSAYCAAFSRTFTTNDPATVWSTGITAASITVNAVGTYWARVNTSCGTFTDSIILSNGVPPVFNLGNDTTYCTTFTRTLNTNDASTVWSTGVTASSINVNAAGTYWARLTNGCGSFTDSITVAVGIAPVFTLGNDTTLCAGQNLTLNSITGNYTYTWSTGSTANSIQVDSSGTYWLQVNNAGCITSDSIDVQFLQIPAPFSLGADTVYCGSFTRSLNAGQTAVWSTGVNAISIQVNQPGVFWAQIQNICGSRIDSIAIRQNAPVVFSLPPDTTICNGDAISLTLTANADNYLWSTGAQTNMVTLSAQGIYWAEVWDSSNCRYRDSINITVKTAPAIELGPDTTVCASAPFVLTTKISGAKYQWQDGSIDSTFGVTVSGTYSVTVTNECGISTDKVDVTYYYDDCMLMVPTAFTPNGDGKNDLFRPLSQCPVEKFEMHVYNRWGEMVYDSKDAKAGWDGSFKNTAQPLSTFVYYIYYFNYCEGKMKAVTGNVTLVR